MTLGQLAAAEQVKPPTMTRIVAGLQRSGLARRDPDPNDARRVRLRATPKGVSLLQRGRQLRISYLASHLKSLNSDQLATLADSIEVLDQVLRDWR